MSEGGCLGCEFIATSAVTLRSGLVVCSSCAAWRHECEVKHVAQMESNEKRAAYLAGVRERRGDEAAHNLRREAWSLMQEQT